MYSVGIYFQEDDLQNALLPQDALSSDISSDLISRILSPTVERSLRLSPYRHAVFSHIRDGFGKAVETRLSRATHIDPAELEAVHGQLQEFKQLFPKGDFNCGDEIVLSVRGTTLRLFHNVR